MSVYLKGGLVSLAILLGALFWYLQNSRELTYQKTPEHYSLIEKMEHEGVPGFELPRLDGSKFQFKNLAGKVVIVNFWASWCNPCVEEFPSFIELIKTFKGDIVLVAVSNDEKREDIEPFLKAFDLPQANIEVVWDKDRSVANTYGVGKIPESFLIGKDGKLIRKVSGTENWMQPAAVEYFKDLVSK